MRHLSDSFKTGASLDQIQHIEHELASKVDKSELLKAVSAHVSGLATKSEVDSLHSNLLSYRRQTEQKLREQFNELEEFLKGIKAESEDAHHTHLERIASKADGKAIEGLSVELIKKADVAYVESAMARLNLDLKKELERVQSRSRSLADSETARVAEATDSLHNEFIGFQEAVKAEVEDLKKALLAARSDKSEDFKLRSEVDRLQASLRELKYSTTEEVNSVKNSLGKAVETEVEDLRGLLGNLQRDIYRQLQTVQDDKARLEDIANSAASMTSREMQIMLKGKADLDNFEDLARTLRQENREIKHYIDSRVGDFNNKTSILEDKLLDISAHVDRVKADSVHRQSFIDLSRTLESKADVNDIRQAVRELNDTLDYKASGSELRTFVQDQEMINEALCGENCLARWIWKSGTLKPTGQVPWEQQSVNTCPDNFIWDKDTTGIVTLAPGLYEVMFGFYARRRPTIQLHVNGEPVLQRTGKIAKPGTRSPGQTISGVTHIDFLALPARATLAVSYSGESAGEGFLCLRKL